jgi:hypothetical protein
MITIGLDTNAFQDNWLARGEAFELLADFIAKSEGRAYVSEITVREHVAHYKLQAPLVAAKAKGSVSQLSNLLLNGAVPALPAMCDTNVFEPAFRNRLKELGIEVVPIPEVTHAALVDRDLKHVRPFNSDGKGYRDALIWLGFLNALDDTTEKAIFVTSNSKDFCAVGEQEFHSDLLKELQQHTPGCSTAVYASPKLLVEEVVKPRLRALAEQEAKTQEILNKIKSETYEHFNLADVVTSSLDEFGAQEAAGPFYVDGIPLEGPIWVTILDGPENLDATALFRLASNSFVCEGTAEVEATVEGFLDKFEAFNQSELGNVFISDPDWNEHYSEVEVSGVPAKITFSFQFDADSSEISKFEVTNVESLQ